ncbi:hypothetical protein ACE6H2_019605 [Prunus campanulata]
MWCPCVFLDEIQGCPPPTAVTNPFRRGSSSNEVNSWPQNALHSHGRESNPQPHG